MATWKCTNCGYTFDAEKPPGRCPSCQAACEFVDISCYTPECADTGIDDRLGTKKD